MALISKPGFREPLGGLVVLGLCSILLASCGDQQDPSFQSKSLDSDAAARIEGELNSGDAIAANPETIDTGALEEAAADAGIDYNPDSPDLEDNTGGSGTGDSVAGDEGSAGSGSSNDSVADSGSTDDGSSSSGSGSTGDSSTGNDSVADSGGSGTSDGSSGSSDGTNEMPATFEPFTQLAVQPDVKPVDILWVVDSSGSMQEEQEYLANNFYSMVNSLVAEGASFQTAVTTTDICDPSGVTSKQCPVAYGGSSETRLQGSFVGDSGRTVLSSADSDVITKFSDYTKVGTSGSGFEHGLEAAEMAVKKSLSGQNDSLVRDGAFLSIIVVSDEEDDGIGLGMWDSYSKVNYVEEGFTDHKYTHNDLINYLKGVKGDGNFAISTVTGTRNSDGTMCNSAHSAPAEEGTQYISAAQQTGGAVESICDTDWSKSLGLIGQDIKAQITQLALEKVPYVPTIKVKVNGEATSNWSYIEATNSVKFDVDHIPAPGAQITVDYYAEP